MEEVPDLDVEAWNTLPTVNNAEMQSTHLRMEQMENVMNQILSHLSQNPAASSQGP